MVSLQTTINLKTKPQMSAKNRIQILFLAVLATLFTSEAQVQRDTMVLNFKEYLGYVKKYHPVAKQAQLTIAIGQANLMKARGGFDPKIEVDYERKEFKGIDYWDRLNATFKIPTWFGIELKGNLEQNQGDLIALDETGSEDEVY